MATPIPLQPPPTPPPLTPEEQAAKLDAERKHKIIVISIIIGIVFILLLVLAAISYLMLPTTPTDKIRDVFIIIVALESLVIGTALIVLIVQLASLINLLQNEVRPILAATSETVNNLRGTVEFLGDEVIEPVMKLSGYLAGLKRMLELMGIKPK